MNIDNLISECFINKKSDVDIIDQIKTKHIEKLKGFHYVKDIGKIEVGNFIKYINLENTKVSPCCRVSNIIYKKNRETTVINKIELKFIIPCNHIICKKVGYKYISGKKCKDVKYMKFTINPRKFYIFSTYSLNNKDSALFDTIVDQYKKDFVAMSTAQPI